MDSRIAHALRFTCVALLLLGCDKNPVVAPNGDDETVGSAVAGLNASSSLTAFAVSSDQVDLYWLDNSTNEAGFEIHRSTGASGTFSLLSTTGENVVFYSDPGLTARTLYCYKVRAFRRAGRKTSYSAFSTTACATTPAPLGVPLNASVKPSSSSAVAITWGDNSGNESGFRVERSASAGGPWDAAITTGVNATSATDGGRASEQQVCYRVIAINSHGESDPSNAACTTPPAGPTGLVSITASQGISLTWADNSVVEDAYEVLRATDGVTFFPIVSLAPGATSYQDLEATTNQMYWYQVRAWNDGGVSDLSNVASAAGSCVATGPVEDVCDNGADDDCDTLTDLYDPDCGAPRCDFDFCPSGMVCNYDGFCVSHCDDGGWNGDEGDVDCGGSCSAKCQAGQHCWTNWDCASGVCVNDVCQPVGGTP